MRCCRRPVGFSAISSYALLPVCIYYIVVNVLHAVVSHLVRTYLLKLVKCEFRLLFVASFFLVDSAQTSVDWRLQCTDTSANRRKFHVYVDNRMLNEDATGPFSYRKHGERRQKTGGSQNKERRQKCEVKETQQKTATFRNTKRTVMHTSSHVGLMRSTVNEI